MTASAERCGGFARVPPVGPRRRCPTSSSIRRCLWGCSGCSHHRYWRYLPVASLERRAGPLRGLGHRVDVDAARVLFHAGRPFHGGPATLLVVLPAWRSLNGSTHQGTMPVQWPTRHCDRQATGASVPVGRPTGYRLELPREQEPLADCIVVRGRERRRVLRQMDDRSIVRVTCCVLSLLALSYVFTRAITVDATYDEVSTIQYFVPESVIAIVTLTTAATTPDHVLNTLLIKLLFATGVQSLFVARLPNVCAFAVYLYFGYRIARQLKNTPYAIGAFLLLILNPFLLDFFSLARGYGLALGAQVASMHYLLEFVAGRRPKRSLVLSLLTAAVAVLCVFSWLHYFVAVAVVAVCAAWLKQQQPGFAVLSTLVASMGLGAILYSPIRRLQQLNMFFYGGQRDFYHDTLVSLAKYSAYSPDPTRASVFALDVALAILVTAICVSWFRRSRVTAETHAVTALLLLPALSVVAQHVILGTPYLIDRAALFYCPLFVVALSFAVPAASDRPFVAPAFAAAVMAAAFNLASHANLYKSALWSFDAHARTILSAINDVGATTRSVQRLDFAWPFEQSTTYHLTHGGFPFVQIVEHPTDPTGFNPQADYYIHLGRPLEKFTYDPGAQKGTRLTEAHHDVLRRRGRVRLQSAVRRDSIVPRSVVHRSMSGNSGDDVAAACRRPDVHSPSRAGARIGCGLSVRRYRNVQARASRALLRRTPPGHGSVRVRRQAELDVLPDADLGSASDEHALFRGHKDRDLRLISAGDRLRLLGSQLAVGRDHLRCAGDCRVLRARRRSNQRPHTRRVPCAAPDRRRSAASDTP